MTSWKLLAEFPNQTHQTYCEPECPNDCDPFLHWKIEDGRVYRRDRLLTKADPATFELMIGHEDYFARDKDAFYYAWQRSTFVDTETLEHVRDSYYRDKFKAYYIREGGLGPLKDDTGEDFACLGNGYARDAKFGYIWGRAIANCDNPSSLRLVPQISNLSGGYAMDDKNVYFEGSPLKKSDPATWEQLEHGYSKDANSIYFCQHKLGYATPQNWRKLDRIYSTNGKRVYYMAWCLEGADPDSFEVLPDGSCRDKISAFSGKQRV